jgi:hypothetical protein
MLPRSKIPNGFSRSSVPLLEQLILLRDQFGGVLPTQGIDIRTLVQGTAYVPHNSNADLQ